MKKRDDFDFDIVNFPFLEDDVPRSTSYGHNIFLSLFVFLECPVMVMTLILVIKFWQQNFSNKDIDMNFVRRFSEFYRRDFDLVSKYNVGLKTLLLQGLSEPEYYGDLVYECRKIIGKNGFPFHFNKVHVIVHYKKMVIT